MCTKNLAKSLVEKVCSRVIVLNLASSLRIYMEAEALSAVCRNALCNVNSEVVFLDGIDNVYLFATLRKNVSCVTHLTTHLCIERRTLKHELIHSLVLCLNCTVAGKLNSLELCVIITKELDVVTVCKFNPVTRLDRSCITSSVLLLLKLCLEALDINLVALLRSDEFRQVDWESECIVKHKSILS